VDEAGPDRVIARLACLAWPQGGRRVKTAFVLGGGGLLGAHEVGMLRALSEAGIWPDVIVGTSVGAINGALVAADPAGAAARLGQLWQGDALRRAFSETLWGRVARLARSGTHLHAIEPLRDMLHDVLPGDDFADLELPFHCVAASIEHASARWFSSGPVVPAVLASCAVPGLLPPVEVDGEHYFDGGLVDSCRGAGGTARPPGHRAQPPRGTRRFIPARAPSAQRVRAAAACRHEGDAAARSRPGRRRQSPAQRVHPAPQNG
jgi:hypothetical protein